MPTPHRSPGGAGCWEEGKEGRKEVLPEPGHPGLGDRVTADLPGRFAQTGELRPPAPAAPLFAARPGPLGAGSVAVNYLMVLTLASGQLWCVVSHGVGGRRGASDLSFLQPVAPRPESSTLLPSLLRVWPGLPVPFAPPSPPVRGWPVAPRADSRHRPRWLCGAQVATYRSEGPSYHHRGLILIQTASGPGHHGERFRSRWKSAGWVSSFLGRVAGTECALCCPHGCPG